MGTTTLSRARPSSVRALRTALIACATVAGVVTLIMAMHIAADVTSRNLLGEPLPVTLEITKNWSMVLIVMLAMGYAEFAGEHIRATVFSQRLSPDARWKSELLVRTLALVTVVALTYYATVAARFSVSVD